MNDDDRPREDLQEVRQRVERLRGSRQINEENTKATLIDPVFRALGWNLEELDEVQREYKVKRADRPVDYALLINRTPRLFIEAKALGQDLDDRRWSNQIMGYAAVAGVEWVVLTDGDEYRLYNAHAAVTVDEKLFRAFKVSEPGTVAEETLSLLVRDRIQENRIAVLWKAQFVDRQVKVVLLELLDPASGNSVLNLLRKRLVSIQPTDLRASLGRARVQVSFPAPAEVTPQVAVRAVRGENRSSRADRATVPRDGIDGTKRPALSLASAGRSLGSAGTTKRTRSTIDVTVKDLIDSGLVRPPLALHQSYLGMELSAWIGADGKVTFDGEVLESLSTAAERARAKALAADGKKLEVVAANGWTFWKYRDEGGEVRRVHDLRQKYLERSNARKDA